MIRAAREMMYRASMAKRPVVPEQALRTILSREPDEKTWLELVSLLNGVKTADVLDALIAEAATRFVQYTVPFERDMPIQWVKRLAKGKNEPRAQLANFLDLGNGISLRQPKGFDEFVTFTKKELDRLLDKLGNHIEILSYSDDVGENPLHPGFMVDSDDAEHMLTRGPWDRVHTLRLNGWGLLSFTDGMFGQLEAFSALKSLEVDGSEMQDELDTDTFQAFLDAPILKQLDRLSLCRYSEFEDEHAQLFVASDNVRHLKRLRLGRICPDASERLSERRDLVIEITAFDDE